LSGRFKRTSALSQIWQFPLFYSTIFTFTTLQHLLHLYRADYSITQIHAQLGKFGLDGDQSLQPIQPLSGDQKTRVVLAQYTLISPHIPILEEVTNNLGMDSMEALRDALLRYHGSIIAVTHGQAFVTRQIFLCRPGGVVEFPATFQENCDSVKAEICDKLFGTMNTKGIV
jgi:ATP-binding cassette subfamily F protein 3